MTKAQTAEPDDLDCPFPMDIEESRQLPRLDPARLPASYVIRAEGCCMMPVYADGDRLMVSSKHRPVVGDDVVVYFKTVETHGTHRAIVKRLAMPLPADDHQSGVVVLEMFNPPLALVYPRSSIEAVHKVTRTVADHEATAWWSCAAE